MRVIAGSAKGRRLRTLRGLSTRPTADKVKGAIFSILGSRVDWPPAHVLDLFAGSGALGIEALSRGAGTVTFVEQSAQVAHVLRDNLRTCGFAERARVLQMPATRALGHLARQSVSCDGLLIDPPYSRGLVEATLRAVDAHGVVRPNGWVIIEYHVEEPLPQACGGLRLTQTWQYGKTGLALFVAHEAAGQQESANVTRAVYAGSFDPITNGHLDVVRRAIEVFDQVIVAVASLTSDARKEHALFSASERVVMITEALADTGGRATAATFSGLLVDYCESAGARVIIRGLRAVSDFEYEFQMAMMNRHLKPGIETMFMSAGETHFYTSSRLVKEVASLGGDVRGLVPDAVHRRLMEKLRPAR
jgi:pantetheine-phosphate adenylyltransferase/16S rRNA (guanine(966)-N(2))-methyltransferase RsmD